MNCVVENILDFSSRVAMGFLSMFEEILLKHTFIDYEEYKHVKVSQKLINTMATCFTSAGVMNALWLLAKCDDPDQIQCVPFGNLDMIYLP